MFKDIVSQAAPFIDRWLQFRYDRLEMPGFVVAIQIDGKVEYLKAYGYADSEKREPMTTDHVFRIASHSKTFAATAIMQMAEEKLLHIDEPVAKYVPWLRDHRDHRMEKVTIRQLMSHSAGMIRDGKDANFWQLTNTFHDLADFKKALLDCDLVFDTNKQMKYSNFGYALLGCVVEEVYGMPFGSYVQAKILQPLGLSNTTSEVNEEMLSRLVVGYTRRGREKHRHAIEKNLDTRQMAAATGFCSTAGDLCKYFDAHFVGSKKLLSDESKKEMQRTQWRVKNSHIGEEYGLGFQIEYVHFPDSAPRQYAIPMKNSLSSFLRTASMAKPRLWRADSMACSITFMAVPCALTEKPSNTCVNSKGFTRVCGVIWQL
jgi:CubicO group peptidase (beta-lactamase class C family)